MITTEPRDMTWQQLRDHLAGPREVIWNWLRLHGPATTTAIAEGTGIGLLTVRPRVSELAVLGFVECTGRLNREGVYQHVTVTAAQGNHERVVRDRQLTLKFS